MSNGDVDVRFERRLRQLGDFLRGLRRRPPFELPPIIIPRRPQPDDRRGATGPIKDVPTRPTPQPNITVVGAGGPAFLGFVEQRPRERVLDEILRQTRGRGTGPTGALGRILGVLGRAAGIGGVVISGAIIVRDVILERQQRRIDREVAEADAEFKRRVDEIKARILRRGRVEVLPSPRPGIDSPVQTPVFEPRVLPTPEPTARPVRTQPEIRPPAPSEIPVETGPIIEIPSPTTAPETEVIPRETPEIPAPSRQPTVRTAPRTRPSRRTLPLPRVPRTFPLPLPRPSIQVRPRLRPGVRGRPTVRVRPRPTIQADPRAQLRPAADPFAQPRTPAQECPPCQRVKEKRRVRGECEEGFFREFTDETQFTTWRVRNCGTGEKLKEEEQLPFGLGDFEVQL